MLARTALVVVMLIFGATFLVIKDVVQYVSPVKFLALRCPVGAAALLVLALFEMRRGRPADGRGDLRSARTWRDGAVLGFAFYLGYLTQTIGLVWTSPAVSAFLTGLSVVLVPVFGVAFRTEKISLPVWLGVLASIAGLGCLTLRGGVGLGPGELVTLLTAVAFGFHIYLTAGYSRRSTAIALTAAQITVAAVLAVVTVEIARFIRPGTDQSAQFVAGGGGLFDPVPARVIAVAVGMGLIATALTFFLQTWAQRRMSATAAATFFILEPVFAALFAWVFWGERFGWLGGLGMLLILAGMIAVETRAPATSG